MHHVEYELLVVSVFSEAVTLSSVTVLDRAQNQLMRIEGDALPSATQTPFARTDSRHSRIGSRLVDVDLIPPPDTAPTPNQTEKARQRRNLPVNLQQRKYLATGRHSRSVPIADIWPTSPDHPGRTLAIIELG